MRRWLTIAVAVVGIAAGAAACGQDPQPSGTADTSTIGDIPDDQAFIVFDAPVDGYRLKVPEGWARTDQATGVTFTDKLNSIQVETAHTPTAPDEASARVYLDTRKTSPGFVAGSITTVDRPVGRILLVTYRLDGPTDPVSGKSVNDDFERYQYFHQGLVLTLTLAAPHGADNVDPWRVVTDSVEFLS